MVKALFIRKIKKIRKCHKECFIIVAIDLDGLPIEWHRGH